MTEKEEKLLAALHEIAYGFSGSGSHDQAARDLARQALKEHRGEVAGSQSDDA